VDHCAVAEQYEFQNIVNFEPRGVQTNAQCEAPGPWECTFYLNFDVAHTVIAQQPLNADCLAPLTPEPLVLNHTPPGDDIPGPFGGPFQGAALPDARCGAEGSGFHFIARNLAKCFNSLGRLGWGASFDLTFRTAADATQWDGISLWVRKGDGPTKPAIILSVVDAYTSGGAMTDPVTGQPVSACQSVDDPMGLIPDIEKCDAFGSAITLNEGWTFVPILFSSMHQKGFGKRSSLGRIDTTTISRLQFLVTSGDWDFWIDDVALFRKK
jgi:hypothetical protein